MSTPMLSIWTVYDKGTDGNPYEYTARLFVVDAGGSHPTGHTMGATDLPTLRAFFERKGLTRIPREPSDEHHIIESWL